MTRLFGEVREDRQTSKFFLASDKIVEVDWNRGTVLVYPLDKISDIEWVTRKDVANKQMARSIKSRYKVSKPQFFLKIYPDAETVGGYPCSHVQARLRLETTEESSPMRLLPLAVPRHQATAGRGQNTGWMITWKSNICAWAALYDRKCLSWIQGKGQYPRPV